MSCSSVRGSFGFLLMDMLASSLGKCPPYVMVVLNAMTAFSGERIREYTGGHISRHRQVFKTRFSQILPEPHVLQKICINID